MNDHAKMISNQVEINIVDDPKYAPNYGNDFKIIKMQKCIVVGNGTVEGNPTVDIQLTDANGKKYLIMATGWLMESITAVVTAKRK